MHGALQPGDCAREKGESNKVQGHYLHKSDQKRARNCRYLELLRVTSCGGAQRQDFPSSAHPRFVTEFTLLFGGQPYDADSTVTCRVVIHLSILAAILLLNLVLAQIESSSVPAAVESCAGMGELPRKDSGVRSAEDSTSVALSRRVRERRRGSAVK